MDRISEVYDVACTESMRDRGHGLYMLGPYVNDLTQECPQLGVRIPRATNSLLTKRKIKKKRACQSLFRFRPKSGGESGGLFSLHTCSDVQTHADSAGRLKQCCSVNLQIPTGELAKRRAKRAGR